MNKERRLKMAARIAEIERAGGVCLDRFNYRITRRHVVDYDVLYGSGGLVGRLEKKSMDVNGAIALSESTNI